MKPSLASRCSHCDDIFQLIVADGESFACPHCQQGAWTAPAAGQLFDRCIFCGCEAFYRQRDFNKYLGLFVIIVAALLVPKTYGLSMPAAFLIDWALYTRTPELVKCYRCKSEYRRYPIPERVKLYDHYTAEFQEKMATTDD
ncbi:MAG: hypothetical protein O3A51_01565 [Verrucomicrobia bacterium]|nr:hypothetical protein [Verrucomicrobiota bacterium]